MEPEQFTPLRDSSQRFEAGGAVREVVLLGGGEAHIEVLRRFGLRCQPGLALTLVTRESEAAATGLLPDLVAGVCSYEDCHVDLRRLARFAGARLVKAETRALDVAGKQIHLDDRPPLGFDLLSIDEIAASPSEIPGAREHVTPLRPLPRFLARWQEIHNLVVTQRDLHVVVLGGGIGGVELVLAMQAQLKHLRRGGSTRGLRFTLLSQGDPLAGFPPRLRTWASRILAERGVNLVGRVSVTQVTPGMLHGADGRRIAFDEAFWESGPAMPSWLAETPLTRDTEGFVTVDRALRSLSHPEIFIAGELARVCGIDGSASGPAAERPSVAFTRAQGAPLAASLRRVAAGRRPREHKAQSQTLAFLCTGDGRAVGVRGEMVIEGRWVRRLKQRLDRRWLQRYRNLPDRPAAPAAEEHLAPQRQVQAGEDQPGKDAFPTAPGPDDALARALGRLGREGRGPLGFALSHESGCGLRESAVLPSPPPGYLVAQAARIFAPMTRDPHLFGRIAASRALDEIYALGGRPRSALALVSLYAEAGERREEDFYQMLSGAGRVLRRCGVDLAGAESVESGGALLGFSLAGLVPRNGLLGKEGLRAGDSLVLLQPLGAQFLIESESRSEPRAGWIDAALDTLAQPSEAASECLARFSPSAACALGVRSLVGHLQGMLDAARLDVCIMLDSLPALNGAATRASFAPSTLEVIEASASARAHPLAALLTARHGASGLLVALPAKQAAACVVELRTKGYSQAAVIGSVQPRRDKTSVIRLLTNDEV